MCIFDVFEKFGKDMSARKTPFNLSNAEMLSKEIRDVGFRSVKYFYAPMNPGITSSEEYRNMHFSMGLKQVYESFTPEI